MSEQFANKATTTLNGAINNSTTSITVTSATGFPTTGDFRILIPAEGGNTDEIMTVTAVSGTTWTVTRASEAIAGVQTASSHSNGAGVKHVLTVGSLRNYSLPVGFIGAKAYNTGQQSISSGVHTAVTFNSEEYDTDGFHSISSNTARMTIPAGLGGKYRLTGVIQFEGNNSGQRVLTFNKNGTQIAPQIRGGQSGGYNTALTGTVDLDLVPGDYVQIDAYQDAGTLNIGDPGGVPQFRHFLALHKLDSGRVGAGVGAKAVWASGSIGAGTYGVVPLNGTEEYDTDGFHSTVSNTGRMTIPAGLGGKYLIVGSFYNATNETNYGRILKNGSNADSVFGVTGDDAVLTVVDVLDLLAGDYVELGINATTTNNILAAALMVMRLDSPIPNTTTRLALDFNYSGSDISGTSISAATWTDIAGGNQTFTVIDAASIVEISVRAMIQAIDTSGGDDFIGLRINIDSAGTPITKMIAGSLESENLYQNPFVGNNSIKLTGLSVGTHTIKVQIYIGGGGDYYLRPSGAGGLEFFAMQVTEIAPTMTTYGMPRVVRGQITPSGTIATGTGFTAAKTATGKYTITFGVPFISTPAITVSPMYNNNEAGDGSTAITCFLDTVSTTEAKIFFLDGGGAAFQDGRFMFIAMEP